MVMFYLPWLLNSGMNFITGSCKSNLPKSYSLITDERVAVTFVKEAISNRVYWLKGTFESPVRLPVSYV
jgi:hypothetical protein